MAWTDDINMECVYLGDRILDCNVKNKKWIVEWKLIAYHGTLYLSEKALFWHNLENLVANLSMPWLLVGDLNEIKNESEKQRGRQIWGR